MSTSPRALVERLAGAQAGDRVLLHGDAVFHLARVLRTRPGDRLRVFDGQGLEAHVRVETVDPRGSRPCVVMVLEENPRPGVGADRARIIWLQGYPKGDKLEVVVRQATELGVLAVWPVYTARSVPRPRGTTVGDARTDRLRAIARAASAQCGRADVPEVRVPDQLLSVLTDIVPEAALRILPWEQGGLPLTEALAGRRCGSISVVLVGPEGGFEPEEVRMAEAHGFVTVSLGPRILRTETVAPALLGALSLAMGDLRGD